MKKPLSLFITIILSLIYTPSFATPKAAENENAPVTSGADVTRPKVSGKPTKTATPKATKTSAKKAHHESTSSKTAKHPRERR
jgi:hypothetical protein